MSISRASSSKSNVSELYLDRPEFPNGTASFLGKGNPSPAKYVIIPTTYPHTEDKVQHFADSFLFEGLSDYANPEESKTRFLASKPDVLLSVTGGAQDFFMYATEVEQVFNRGIVKAAQNTNAWIVDGGFDLGVMQYVGQAMKSMGVEEVPCIGVAMHQRVSSKDELTTAAYDKSGQYRTHAVEYVHHTEMRKVALNPNHTHFILVDSLDDTWAQEIVFRSRLEKCIQDKFNIPVVLIVVNGGPGTLKTIAEGAEKGFTVIVVQGSGRASDAVAALIRQNKAHSKEAKKSPERGRNEKDEKDAKDKKDENGEKAKKDKKAKKNEKEKKDKHKDKDQGEEKTDVSKGKEKAPESITELIASLHYDGVDISAWHNLLAEERIQNRHQCIAYMDRILARQDTVTVFNLDYEAATDMDLFILRSILNSPGQTMAGKLKLGVKWNRPDIVNEILENEKSSLSSDEKRKAINDAFQLSVELDRPEVFRILAQNAQKESIKLVKLYCYKPIKKANFRLMHEYANAKFGKDSPENAGKKNRTEWTSPEKSKTFFKQVFYNVGPAFRHYYDQRFVKFQEEACAQWACVQLAAEINANSTKRSQEISPLSSSSASPIKRSQENSAPLSSRSAPSTPIKSPPSSTGFPPVATPTPGLPGPQSPIPPATIGFIDVLIWAIFAGRMEFAKAVWQLTSLPIHSALLACKLFRYLSYYSLDKEQYFKNADWFEDEVIKILDKVDYSDIKDVLHWKWERLGVSAVEIAQDAKCQRFISHTHFQRLLDDMFYADLDGKVEHTTSTFQIWFAILFPFLISLVYKFENENKNIRCFYLLPIVRFWTNTFFYALFLTIQAYVLCTLKANTDFEYAEWALWIWVTALLIDELTQFGRDPRNHFNAAINILIVACIFSWTRLLSTFAINKSLGRLYFIIIRLFKDIFVWIFVFVIFAVSFQLGFISITQQVNLDPLSPYPDGTFPVSFFTIIGEFSYAAEMLKAAPLGVALLAVYALLAQILLVNLLIAMMGDTYTKVSDNSALQWKSYRLDLVLENQSTSFHPPPTNLVIVPIQQLHKFLKLTTNKSAQAIRTLELCLLRQPEATYKTFTSTTTLSDREILAQNNRDTELNRHLQKLEVARDQVLEEEKEVDDTSVQTVVCGVSKRLSALAMERVNDRSFNKKKFRETSKGMDGIQQGFGKLKHDLEASLKQGFGKLKQDLEASLQQQLDAATIKHRADSLRQIEDSLQQKLATFDNRMEKLDKILALLENKL